MSRLIFSSILIIVAIAVFFSFIDPEYKEIKELKIEDGQFDEALERSKELQTIRDELLSKYNTFSTDELDRIEKLLPDNVDNIRLILDLDGIASLYGILIQNVSISDGGRGKSGTEKVIGDEIASSGVIAVTSQNKLGRIDLSFDVTASYDVFKLFLKDLEKSLRIVDIKNLSIGSKSDSNNLLSFKITIRTYWLK